MFARIGGLNCSVWTWIWSKNQFLYWLGG